MTIEYEHNTEERVLARAKELGATVRYPKDCELFIDIDSRDDLDNFYALLRPFTDRLLKHGMKVGVEKIKTNRGWHMVVSVEGHTFDATERLAFQAALGSDRQRELACLTDMVFFGCDPKVSSVLFTHPAKRKTPNIYWGY